MKKGLLSIIFLFSMVLLSSDALAIADENMTGNPDENENHFIWGIMSQLQTPDDSDCSSIAESTLISEGVSAGEAASIATEACAGIASMRTDMQSDMNSGGEGIETNLWDATDWHAVENLYFQHSTDGVVDGRISFSQPIDFMSYAFMNFMMNFGDNMDTDSAYISLDADVVGGFANYGATLVMYDVPEFENPVILVDGEEDSEGVVSNIVYDRANNTLTFSAAHFTTFEAVEGSVPEIDKVKVRKFMSSNGKERVRVVAHGKNFDKGVKIKLGSRDAYNTRRSIKKGKDKVEAYFDLDDLQNSGKRKMTIHVINSNDSETDHDDKADLEDMKALKIWEYAKIYKDAAKKLLAQAAAMMDSDYVRY
jgi:hypothetical protein